MKRTRLEKEDRTSLKERLIARGCFYVRVRHGSMFQRDRPDLEGLGRGGRGFAVELKRSDRDPRDVTPGQASNLKAYAASGGVAFSAVVVEHLKQGWVDWVKWGPLDPQNRGGCSLDLFADMCLGRME